MDTPDVVLALSRGSVNFAFLTLLPTTAWDLIFIPSSFLHSKAILEPPSRHPGAERVVLLYGKSWHPSELTEIHGQSKWPLYAAPEHDPRSG